jgi:hypothetical protein
MDAERFDRITKALQGGTNRRRVLGGLTVGVVAGLLAQHEAGAAKCTKAGKKPTNRKPCCVGTPVDGLCPTPVMGACLSMFGCRCITLDANGFEKQCGTCTPRDVTNPESACVELDGASCVCTSPV